jgi:hypothetical protein
MSNAFRWRVPLAVAVVGGAGSPVLVLAGRRELHQGGGTQIPRESQDSRRRQHERSR